MFTGLVETLGQLQQWQKGGDGARMAISVQFQKNAEDIAIGDSVAVNGACLTAIAVTRDGPRCEMAFELSHETLALTGFAQLQIGDSLNIERALRLGDRLGGHIVTGHVDGLGRLQSCEDRGGAWDLLYAIPEHLAADVAVKGSICVDGISLTVNRIDDALVGVTIIPHTTQNTQIMRGHMGKIVHIETDLLAKHVRRLLEVQLLTTHSEGITLTLLQKSGFLRQPLI